jgi:prolyl-tRNA synthetase
LAWRSLRKIEAIIRHEMDTEGAQELRMSALQPVELWEESGRLSDMQDVLLKVRDRRERELVIAPTHEEEITSIVRSNVNSYRDLPQILYQIQTKFRDEERPRGGLLRVREFDMKDAYSFDSDETGLDLSYQAMVRAYNKIFAKCGLDFVKVEADSGAIGGKDSQEFMALTDVGEDTILMCEKEGCDYAANDEKAEFIKANYREDSELPLEEIHTPNIKTIDSLADFVGVPTNKTLKSVFYSADGDVIIAVVRGDLEVNEIKLKNALGVGELVIATPEQVEMAGLVAGSASPVGLSGITTVADESVEMGSNFVVGANKHDYHLLNANFPRDFEADVKTDIALAREGDACIKCESPMVGRRGIEVGHVFKLGTKYAEALGALFPTEHGTQEPIIMGCYGIGVGRLLASSIEQNHDEDGIVFPASIAPYDVWITALSIDKQEVLDEAVALHDELQSKGLDVLLDDRDESAGVKFNDADLLGLPVRVVVSPRNIKEGVVEVKLRASGDAAKIARPSLVGHVQGLLAD